MKKLEVVNYTTILLLLFTSFVFAQDSFQIRPKEKLTSNNPSIREQGIKDIVNEREKIIKEVLSILSSQEVMLVNQADIKYKERKDWNIYNEIKDLEYNRAIAVDAIKVLGELRAEEAVELLAQYIYFRAETPSKSRIKLGKESMPSGDYWPAVVALKKIGKPSANSVIKYYLDELSPKHLANVENVLLKVLSTWNLPPKEYNNRTIKQHELFNLNKKLNVHTFVSSFLFKETDNTKKVKLEALLDSLEKGISAQKNYYKEHYGQDLLIPSKNFQNNQQQQKEPKPNIPADEKYKESENNNVWIIILLAIISIFLAVLVIVLLVRGKR